MNDFAGPQRIFALLRDWGRPWGVAGGWAIDLFLNRPTRFHKDIEVAVFRRDQGEIRRHLTAHGWSFQKVQAGKFFPWAEGETLQSPVHEIWCRSEQGESLELLLNECSDTEFIFRRQPAIRLPIAHAFLESPSGIPILAPEIVLLYKSKRSADDNERADFDSIVNHLELKSRLWLCESLSVLCPEHAWVSLLRCPKSEAS
jgi:hypothetical protein